MFLKDDYYYVFGSQQSKIIKRGLISQVWSNVPNNIDGAYSLQNGDIHIFKGDFVYVLKLTNGRIKNGIYHGSSLIKPIKQLYYQCPLYLDSISRVGQDLILIKSDKILFISYSNIVWLIQELIMILVAQSNHPNNLQDQEDIP